MVVRKVFKVVVVVCFWIVLVEIVVEFGIVLIEVIIIVVRI